MNTAYWMEDSSSAMEASVILKYLSVFLLFYIPNSWLGSFMGFKKGTIKVPGKINKLSREIPPMPWYLKTKTLIPISGATPLV